MRASSGREPQRGGWSAAVWVAVVLSGSVVRVIVSGADSETPFGFALAATWVVAAVSAAHWSVSQWTGRNG